VAGFIELPLRRKVSTPRGTRFARLDPGFFMKPLVKFLDPARSEQWYALAARIAP
jgi:hypothetical protein